MPELPDVEAFERVLARGALRKTIERVVVKISVSWAILLRRRSSAAFKAPGSLRPGGMASISSQASIVAVG